MSAAALTVQAAALAGLNPAYVAANVDGNFFLNSGKEYLHVKNGGASPITVTINSQVNCNQGFDHDAVVSIPAGGERIIGPFPKDRFNDASGYVQAAYSGVTSVTAAAITVA
jgi:hypothetical protein